MVPVVHQGYERDFFTLRGSLLAVSLQPERSDKVESEPSAEGRVMFIVLNSVLIDVPDKDDCLYDTFLSNDEDPADWHAALRNDLFTLANVRATQERL
jgi:hypothetical protein